jgi:hypothetical protein
MLPKYRCPKVPTQVMAANNTPNLITLISESGDFNCNARPTNLSVRQPPRNSHVC